MTGPRTETVVCALEGCTNLVRPGQKFCGRRCSGRARTAVLAVWSKDRSDRYRPEDDAVIRELWGAKDPSVIGRRIQRTARSVTQRATLLGLRSRGPRKLWTPSEDAALRNWMAKGRGYTEISRKLKRSPGSVEARVRHLELNLAEASEYLSTAQVEALTARSQDFIAGRIAKGTLRADLISGHGRGGKVYRIRPSWLREAIDKDPEFVRWPAVTRDAWADLVHLLTGKWGE